MTSPKVLFIGATHGDEPIGVHALCALSQTVPDLDWIIGNPPAFRKNARMFEGDLNRSAPGSIESPQYASRRAAEILEKARAYDYCLDLHGTEVDCGIFIILTKCSPENLRLAARFNISRIVFWPSFSSELKGPLSEYFPCGLEIECGPKNDPNREAELIATLERFMKEKNVYRNDEETKTRLRDRELFEVTGSLKTDRTNLEEFREVTINGEQKYPLLINRYRHLGITAYVMDRKTIDDWW